MASSDRTTTTATTPTVTPGRPHGATWPLRRPWLAAIALALVPVVFTAGASAAAQLSGATEVGGALILAAGAAASAALGLAVMRRSPATLRSYGLRQPARLRAALWLAPAALTVLIMLVSQGIRVNGPTLAAYGVLVVAVALNEETWFRGIVLAVLRARSVRTAIVGSSVLFGVLHLANVAGGEDAGVAILQVVFAALFGLVAAQLVVLTGSLWPVIVWHAAWNFVSFAGGNTTDTGAMVGLVIASAVMLAYAVLLWRRALPPTRAETSDAHAPVR